MNMLPDTIDFAAYLRETDAKANVKKASAYRDDMKEHLRHRQTERRVFLPWPKTMRNFDFRPGEVTVWAGVNGHGKSLVTSMVALSLLGQEQKVCVASFEMKPRVTLQRMAQQYAGMNLFSPEFQADDGLDAVDAMYDEFHDWTDGRLWLYTQNGTTDPDLVLGMVRYCATELGVQHVFVDNLAKVVKGEDDYTAQKTFVDQLTAIARDHNIHVHLVHHVKKGAKETDLPDKNDVKGSGSIIDQPDNLIMVYRNKIKEIAIKAGKGTDKVQSEPDQILFVRKQRNYTGSADGEPQINLWFDLDSLQYRESPQAPALFFVNFPHVASM
jgi:twinkle protein